MSSYLWRPGRHEVHPLRVVQALIRRRGCLGAPILTPDPSGEPCPCCCEPMTKMVTIGTWDAARTLRVEIGDEVCRDCYETLC